MKFDERRTGNGAKGGGDQEAETAQGPGDAEEQGLVLAFLNFSQKSRDGPIVSPVWPTALPPKR